MDENSQLVEEYKILWDLVKYWDLQTWQTSRFFIAIEGALIAGVLWLFYNFYNNVYSISDIPIDKLIFNYLFLATGCIIGIILCLMWKAMNYASRLWLDVRFNRITCIESKEEIYLKIFKDQKFLFDDLPKNKKVKRRKSHTAKMEILGLPLLYIGAWLFIYLTIICLMFKSNLPNKYSCLPIILTISGCLLFLIVIFVYLSPSPFFDPFEFGKKSDKNENKSKKDKT